MVQAGTLFEYLAAFITIVLGLALADLLVSLHRLLRARHRVVWRPLPLLLALFILLTLVTSFFELWAMTRWERISYYELVWMVVGYIPMFLAACAVLPDEVPPGPFDLDTFYWSERRYVISLLTIGFVISVGQQLVSDWARIVASPRFFLAFFLPLNLLCLAAFAAIAWSKRRWVHWLAFAALGVVSHIGYSGWSATGGAAVVAAPNQP